MSKFHDNETLMDDRECLMEALAANGKKAKLATDQVNGDRLYGYQGDKRADRAHIVIPRGQLSDASNDIGFRREENGTYTAVVSEYDSQIGYGAEWLGGIRKTYLEKKKTKELTTAGYTNIQREEVKTDAGTRIRITATPPAQQAAQMGFRR